MAWCYLQRRLLLGQKQPLEDWLCYPYHRRGQETDSSTMLRGGHLADLLLSTPWPTWEVRRGTTIDGRRSTAASTSIEIFYVVSPMVLLPSVLRTLRNALTRALRWSTSIRRPVNVREGLRVVHFEPVWEFLVCSGLWCIEWRLVIVLAMSLLMES